MKLKEFTKDAILFDNGIKISCEFHYPTETPAFRYYVDFHSLANQLEGKELEGNFIFFARPRKMAKSPDLLFDLQNSKTGFCMKFGEKYSSFYEDTVYYVPMYKKANPNFFSLDIDAVYQTMDRMLPPQSGMQIEPYPLPFVQACQKQVREYLQKVLSDHPIPDYSDAFSMTLKCGDVVAETFHCQDFMYLPCQYAHAEEPVHYDPQRAMKIVSVSEDAITFSNGKSITFTHNSCCCEDNYADFQQIDDIGRNAVYFENELIFESVEGSGFRFGNRGGLMTFIPCYTVQDWAYYTGEIDLFYNGRSVLHVEKAQWYDRYAD